MFLRYILATAAAVLVVATVSAGDGDSAAIEEQIAKDVKNGPGVYVKERSKEGRIISLVVVGQARISTVLGRAKGLETARAKADLACSAEFVKWLKGEVSVYTLSDEETVALVEGTKAGEAESLKESSKSIEKNGTKMESVSKGLVRGLQILHKDINADGELYTIVKGWNADSSEGVKRIAADLASDAPVPAGGGKKNPGPKRLIESESSTSDAAGDFYRSSKSK